MLKLNSITFKDDETGKIIEVNINGSVTADGKITTDEYVFTSFYTGIIFGGGFMALRDFINPRK